MTDTAAKLRGFEEIWLARFEVHRPPGECPRPLRLTARECRTGRVLQVEGEDLAQSRLPAGDNALYVTWDAPTQLGCFLTLGWHLPRYVLDLQAECCCATAGRLTRKELDEALACLGVPGDGVNALGQALIALLPTLDLPRALLRGRYTASVARMEDNGIPIDMVSLTRLRDGWERIQAVLIERVDRHYGVYAGGKFQPRRWAAWVNRNGIRWPRLAPGRLDLSLEAFRDMAVAHPEVRPMKELRATLGQLRLFRLAVGADGRNRCPLRPFASKTGRNQPSTAEFIFGPATWLRGLIKPGPGMALAYVDYEQQEFGIAAALSGDANMLAAYSSGDPYLTFAMQAGAVPDDATKQTHHQERELFKTCALAVQYGMGARSLATRLRVPHEEAEDLLKLHKATYERYWRWSRKVGQEARAQGQLQAAFGWTLHVGPDANPRSVRNFPLQGNGAEMLRLACWALTEKGMRVCAPVHDALLIEAPIEDIDQAAAVCQREMAWASEQVLEGFSLRTDAKVVRYPERYRDERGQAMWQMVFDLLDQDGAMAA